MTDIVEQAARVLKDHPDMTDRSANDGCECGYPDPRTVELHQAQMLADAGLLAEPARTVPTRDEIADVQDLEMSLDRVVIRDADGDIYERQGELETERGTYAAWLGTHNGIKPSPDIRLPATVIYVPGEIVGDRPTVAEVKAEAWEHEGHRPTQHRDGKPPWCRECGYTSPAPAIPAQQIRDGK